MTTQLATASNDTTLDRRPRVLVVDDIEENRDLLTRRVEREGYEAESAENGQRALEMLEEKEFDLVLLDIMMPVMNGYEVLERMKRDMHLKHVPVIVVSASGEEENAVQCINLGAEDYLNKPPDKVLLKARLNASLQKKLARDQELEYRRRLDKEKRRADELLYSLYPPTVIQELKANGTYRPRRYENVAILFSDIVGFTSFCDEHDPAEVVSLLERMVEEFECIAKDCELEKIKTIGDAFMAAGNISSPLADPVLNCIRCGQEMIAAAARLPSHWDLRVGVHCGPVVAGVIGTQKCAFDIWGDTVNVASRVESYGEEGAVNVSASAWEQIDHCCRGESFVVDVKGKGPLEIVRFKRFIEE